MACIVENYPVLVGHVFHGRVVDWLRCGGQFVCVIDVEKLRSYELQTV